MKSEYINRYLRTKIQQNVVAWNINTMEKYSDRYGKNIAKGKISFYIFRFDLFLFIYLFIYFFLIDSYLRIFHATRLKRQRDHFNDISHAFHTESNTILIKHRKLSDERNKSRVMAC